MGSGFFWCLLRGTLSSDILPFKLGEFGRSIYVGQLSGLGTFRAFSSVVIERAFDVAVAACLVLITLPLVIGASWVKTIAQVALLVVVAGMVLLFFVVRNQEPVVNWLNKIAEKRPFLKDRVVPQVEKLIQGFGMLTRPSQFVLSFAWIAATWLIWVSSYYLTIRQLSAVAPFWWGYLRAPSLAWGWRSLRRRQGLAFLKPMPSPSAWKVYPPHAR